MSPEKERKKGRLDPALLTVDDSPVPTTKRKRASKKSGTENVAERLITLEQEDDRGGLADRIKRRRRKEPVFSYVVPVPA